MWASVRQTTLTRFRTTYDSYKIHLSRDRHIHLESRMLWKKLVLFGKGFFERKEESTSTDMPLGMGNSILAPRCICSLDRKIFFELSKIFDKKLHIHIYLCSLIQFDYKTEIFCGLCKKDKKFHVKNIIFSTKFYLFYTGHKTTQFFMKRLHADVACEDLRANFLFDFF